jgi:DNA (cytosine-5)-methyltransferase 1
MHDDNTDYSEGLTKEELVKNLYKLGISGDGKTPMDEIKISRKGEKWLRETYNNFKATHNVGSITNISIDDLELNINKGEYVDIWTYSFPCQDISLAGHQAGFEKDSGTRSALLWEVERLLNEAKDKNVLPEILILENVEALINKKNMPNFQIWLDTLSELGYSSYWKKLNAKDYGVAQNRKRIYAISILGNYEYNFPDPIPLIKRFEDYLEDNVDESFYINTEKADKLIGSLIDRGVLPKKKQTFTLKNMSTNNMDRVPDAVESDIGCTVLSRDWKGLTNYSSSGVIELEKERAGVDLTTNHPEIREVANCIKAGSRGITNFRQDEFGVVEENTAWVVNHF